MDDPRQIKYRVTMEEYREKGLLYTIGHTKIGKLPQHELIKTLFVADFVGLVYKIIADSENRELGSVYLEFFTSDAKDIIWATDFNYEHLAKSMIESTSDLREYVEAALAMVKGDFDASDVMKSYQAHAELVTRCAEAADFNPTTLLTKLEEQGRKIEPLLKKAAETPLTKNDWVHIVSPPSSLEMIGEGSRKQIKLYMGQGVVGDLRQIQLFSGQFSNCRPVFLYNRATKRGGLFHYPGGGLGGKEKHLVAAALECMCHAVNPTDVYLFQGLEPNPKDSPLLRDFFRAIPTVKEIAEGEKVGGIRISLDEDERLRFQKGKDPNGGEIDLNNVSKAVSKLPPGCDFFGVLDAGGYSDEGGLWQRL